MNRLNWRVIVALLLISSLFIPNVSGISLNSPGGESSTKLSGTEEDYHVKTKSDALEGYSPLTIHFWDESYATGGITAVGWSWDLGDGQKETGKDITHTYSSPGVFAVVPSVIFSDGKVISGSSASVRVYTSTDIDFDSEITGGGIKLDVPESESGTYTFDLWKKKTGFAPLKVRFDVKGRYSTAKGIPTFLWDFGDGGRSSEMFPVHLYEKAGVYTVSLTLTGADGTMNKKKERYITVLPLAHYFPSPLFGWAPLSVKFGDWSTGEPTSFLWDLKDGTTSTEQSPTHVYERAGEYIPHLTVSRDGLSDTLTKVGASGGYGGSIGDGAIIVMPVADFSASVPTGDAPLKVSFTDLSKGSPDSYSWNFGDGSPVSSVVSPEHTFEKPGTYPVTLTVTTGNLTHQKTGQIFVQAATVSINARGGPGGSISPDGVVKVAKGKDVTYTVTPDPGYGIIDVLVNGKSVGLVQSYTFTDIQADSTISVSFKAIPGTSVSTPSLSLTPTPSVTPTPAITHTPTLSLTPTPGVTPTPAITHTPTPTPSPSLISPPLITPHPTLQTPVITPVQAPVHGDNMETVKQTIIDLINKERTSRGLPPLVRDPALDMVAQYHSNTGANKGWRPGGQCTKGSWSGDCAHLDWDNRIPDDRAAILNYPVPKRTLDGGCESTYVGENSFQAKGYSPSSIPNTAVDGWMASPGHKRTLLDSPVKNGGDASCGCNGKTVSCKFTRIGIGISKNGDGKWYINTNFV